MVGSSGPVSVISVRDTEVGSMRRRVIAVAAVVIVVATPTGIAIAAASGDDDRPLTGTTLERASAAALAHTGGGTIVGTEVGDDGAAYGVEVERADGTTVEVSVDESFHVIGEEADEDGPNNEQDGDAG
jgi:hypothetical protein